MTTLLRASFGLFLFAGLIACSSHGKKHKKKDKESTTGQSSTEVRNQPAANDGNAAAPCDTSLWKYVYNRERLEVIQVCKTVTGVIEESSADEDGDQHMLLKLDSGQDGLLTKKNKKKKQGDLVLEVVCANTPSLKKVGATCTGYANGIVLPAVGDHVRATGSLVIDGHNGWAEIHPVTKIEKL